MKTRRVCWHCVLITAGIVLAFGIWTAVVVIKNDLAEPEAIDFQAQCAGKSQ